MTNYSKWTLLRLLHYYYWQPQYEDRKGIKLELLRRHYSFPENSTEDNYEEVL